MTEVAEGNIERWADLAAALDPLLSQMASQQRIGRLRGQEDVVRDVVVRALEKLYANDQSIVRELSSDKPRSLEAWIRVMVRRTAIDYMRVQPEFDRGGADRDPDWISLVTIVTGGGEAAADSIEQKRNHVLRDLDQAITSAVQAEADAGDDGLTRLAQKWGIPRLLVARLVKHADRFRAVIDLFFQGFGYVEIAAKLALSPREVELSVQYVKEFLAALYAAGSVRGAHLASPGAGKNNL